MTTPPIVFAPQALDIVRRTGGRREPDTHDDAVGGLLIGKRVGDQLMILAATEPGPNADDRRLGIALDVGYINAVLEAWFARDPDVDIIGMWHTHPHDLHDLTLDDVAAAYTLREDSGREVVSAIAVAGDEQNPVRCFYLDATNTQTVGLVPLSYSVGGDAPVVVPVFPTEEERMVANEQRGTEPNEAFAEPTSPSTEQATAGVARVYDDAEFVLTPAPAVGSDDVRSSVRPAPSRPRAIAAVLYAIVVLLLLFGLLRFFRGSGATGSDVPSTTAAGNVAAVVDPGATTLPVATSTTAPTDTPMVPTDTPAPSPTTPPTPTEAATETLVPATPTAEVAATTVPVTTTEVAGATTIPVTTTAEGPPLPYVLVWEPMPENARGRFLARARAANCADCYNVDLIGPEPYRELRVRIDNGPATLRTFDVPALGNVTPRDEPHTLQAFDAQNNPVSPPLDVEADPGNYYILRITVP